jgi:hypothetical protein
MSIRPSDPNGQELTTGETAVFRQIWDLFEGNKYLFYGNDTGGKGCLVLGPTNLTEVIDGVLGPLPLDVLQ